MLINSRYLFRVKQRSKRRIACDAISTSSFSVCDDANKCGLWSCFSSLVVPIAQISMWVKPADHLVLDWKNILDSTFPPPPPPTVKIAKTANYDIKIDDVQVIAREAHFWKRKYREAIEIRTQQPSLNRDAGHDLPAHLRWSAVTRPLPNRRSCD